MYNEEFGDTNGTLEEGMSVEYHKAEVMLGQQYPRRNPSPLEKVERRPYDFAGIQDLEMLQARKLW